MLHPQTLPFLQKGRNLLAFSAGVDSTALFFLLEKSDIAFDLAIVNYQTRPESNEESAYAEELAAEHGKTLYSHTVKLGDSNFEHEARRVRYAFFEGLIERHGYDSLILAHQLDDQLEWFLMQLTKGAGLLEMVGMQALQKKETYTLIRPLLQTSKQELLKYLSQNGIRYFVDSSNHSLQHTRNYFRQTFSEPLLAHYAAGIKKSFAYMEKDRAILQGEQTGRRDQNLFIIKAQPHLRQTLHHIDQALKQLGILPSHAQKQEILQTRNCVIAGKIAVVFQGEHIFVAPYRRTTMQKEFKESCRKARIPAKVRPYLYEAGIDPEKMDYFGGLL